MRVIIQVSDYASVEMLEQEITREIAKGFTLLVGFSKTDNEDTVKAMAKKLVNLRILEDEAGKMNLSILNKQEAILSIPQFTLYADCKKGNRPSFVNVMDSEKAKELFSYFNSCLREYGVLVEEGIFQTNMHVLINNMGPITIILDSEEIIK